MNIILTYIAFNQGHINNEILRGVNKATKQNSELLKGHETATAQASEVLEGLENATEQNTIILREIEQLTNDIFLIQKAQVQSTQAAREIIEILLADKNITIPEELRRQLLIAPEAAAPS